jgi:hypothetical protein
VLGLGCSSGFGAAFGEAAAAAVVGVVVRRRRCGIGLERYVRSLEGRWGRLGSRALGARVDVGSLLCMLLDLTLVRHSEKTVAAVLVVPCSAIAAAERIGTASWSCTGRGVAGEETECVRHLARQQVDLCIVDEVVGSAAVATMTNHSTVCSSHPAAD